MFCEKSFIDKCYDKLFQSSFNFQTDDYEDLKPIITNVIDDICVNDFTSADLKSIVETYLTEEELEEFKVSGVISEETYKNLAFDVLSYKLNPKILNGFIEKCSSECGTDDERDVDDDFDDDDLLFPYEFFEGGII
jgi:hypothetical protein